MKSVNSSYIARLLLMTTRNVEKLVNEGIVPRYAHGEYRPEDCVHGYIKYLRGLSKGTSKSLTEERTRLTKSQADNEELKLQRAKGVLIHTEKALEIWGGILSAFKSKIESVSMRMNPIIDNIETESDKREAKEEIETLHREALHELSSIDTADYTDDNPSTESSEAPTKSKHKRVGGQKKGSKPGVVKRTRKVENKKS